MAGFSSVSRATSASGVNSHHSHTGVSTSSNQKQKAYPQLSRKFVARRISEGETGRLKEELKCQACGKGYKHVSSLAKHLWEHTPEWNVTSKLLISKHQQVQLLEAASILVSMNDEDSEDPENGEGSADSLSRESSKEPKSEDERESKQLEERIDSKFDSVLEKTLGSAVDKDLKSRLRSNYRNLRPEAIPESALESTAEPSDASSKQRSVSIERDSESAIDAEELTPARDIPILSARPIAKTPARHGHRRLSTNTGSLGTSLNSLALGRPDHIMLMQASPLPESVLAKDHAHHPPQRRRRQSTLHASSVPHESYLSPEDDGLQDPQDSIETDAPHTPKQSPKHSPKRSTANDDVFGLEV